MSGTRQILLTFHGLGRPPGGLDPEERDVWLAAEAFEDVLDRVRREASVAITFDDGNKSDVTVALPALLERGLSARFFVVAGRTGLPGYLDGADLRALHAAGMEIGSHGMRHRTWRGLEPAELREEVHEARLLIEEAAGTTITAAACPFGQYDRAVVRALRREGYDRVYTSDGGPTRPSAWMQPRNTVHAADHADLLERLVPNGNGSGGSLRGLKHAIKRLR